MSSSEAASLNPVDVGKMIDDDLERSLKFNRNSRSVQDDTVVVEILPESEWVCPSSVVLEDEPEEDDKVALEFHYPFLIVYVLPETQGRIESSIHEKFRCMIRLMKRTMMETRSRERSNWKRFSRRVKPRKESRKCRPER